MGKTVAAQRDSRPGRHCAVCGYGQTPRRGGLMGATSNLQAAGYDIPHFIDKAGVDRGQAMLFAHLKCLQKIHGK